MSAPTSDGSSKPRFYVSYECVMREQARQELIEQSNREVLSSIQRIDAMTDKE